MIIVIDMKTRDTLKYLILECLAEVEEIKPDQLEMGEKEEMEHTSDPLVARKIAIDHLKEDPNYYTKLKNCMA